MQIFVVTFLLVCLSILVVSENIFDSWKNGAMVYPCGPSRDQHRGGRKSMIYDCRGTSADGQSGSGAGGGQGGISVVETEVDDNGMVYVPKEQKINRQSSQRFRSDSRRRDDIVVDSKDITPEEPTE